MSRKERTPQPNSKNSKQLHRTISWNVLDPEEKADYDFTYEMLNFAGEVKRWIRSRRLGALEPMVMMLGKNELEHDIQLPVMSEESALDSIVG